MTCGGVCVGSGIKVAATFGSRFLGLMFRKRLPEGAGLLLIPCGSVHMCFMRMPLDIVYMDGHFRVLAVEENLKPWRLGAVVKGARSVLELPAGAAGRCGIVPGSVLKVHPESCMLENGGKRENHGYERAGKHLES